MRELSKRRKFKRRNKEKETAAWTEEEAERTRVAIWDGYNRR